MMSKQYTSMTCLLRASESEAASVGLAGRSLCNNLNYNANLSKFSIL